MDNFVSGFDERNASRQSCPAPSATQRGARSTGTGCIVVSAFCERLNAESADKSQSTVSTVFASPAARGCGRSKRSAPAGGTINAASADQ